MKNQHYVLWAVGPDRPGIVADLSKILYEKGCNLEDSSMMRLGSEFGVLLIFTSAKKLGTASFSKVEKKFSLAIGLKPISDRLAVFRPVGKNPVMVTVHGFDRPGLVHQVTQALARRRFNISDLSTHRTGKGKHAGYILFIEGELRGTGDFKPLRRDFQDLAHKLGVQINVQPIQSNSL